MKQCPFCYCELVCRSGIKVCPRNEIGDCRYDAYAQHNQSALLRPRNAIRFEMKLGAAQMQEKA